MMSSYYTPVLKYQAPDGTARPTRCTYRVLADALLSRTDIGPAEKLVLMALQVFGREGRPCFPSYARIGLTSGLSTSTAKRAIRALVDLGLITIIADPRTPKGRRIDRVWMSDPTLHPDADGQHHLGGQIDPLGGDDLLGGHPDLLGGDNSLGGQIDPRPRGSICIDLLGGQDDLQENSIREHTESKLSAETSRPSGKAPGIDPLTDPSRPEVERLVSWIEVQLRAEDHDDDSIAETTREARKWCGGGLDAIRFAEAIQKAVENRALRPARYIAPILGQMREAADAGCPIEAPGLSSFTPDSRLKPRTPIAAYAEARIDPLDRAYWARARRASPMRATKPASGSRRRHEVLQSLGVALQSASVPEGVAS